MLSGNTNIDFYAPPANHRDQAKQRLNRQREDMFSWRSDARETSFHPVTGERVRGVAGFSSGPKQVLLKDSQRAADAAETARKARESLWTSASAASVVAPDRRRQWRMTGFVFEKSHFTSSGAEGSSKPHNSTKNLSGRVKDPYVPYFHDNIVLCEPAVTVGPADGSAAPPAPTAAAPVTAFAVTCNRTEAEAASAANDNRANTGSTRPAASLDPAVVGPALAARQKAMELAENMYEGLVMRQATLTGTAVGSAESLDVRLPTSEVAYTLRQSFVDKQASKRANAAQRRKEQQQQQKALASSSPTAVSAKDRLGRPLLGHKDRRESMYSSATTAIPFSSSTTGHGNGGVGRPSDPPRAAHAPDSQNGTPLLDDSRSQRPPLDKDPLDDDDEDRSHSDRSGTTANAGASPYPGYVSDGYSSAIPPLPAGHPGSALGARGEDGEEPVGSDILSSREGSPRGLEDGEGQSPSDGSQDRSEEQLAGAVTTTTGALPSEAKAMRLYSVVLKKGVTDQDMTMVRRQEPTRRGVAVVLPDSWRSPMSY